ncbi:MAG: ATP-dependent 6-phosphofructokinase [Steroidobacteraceae bacterium]|jgi:6-phosphofructokinase 1
MQRLAVLTSGGDAPGMNAAIRSVVRNAVARGFEVVGVHDGYRGLAEGAFRPMGRRDVGGIIQLGGTMLGTTRFEPLKTPEGREQALNALRMHQIAALVVIGGNGSQSGAAALHADGAPVIGIASTIDNDLYGTDISVGATTAIDVALQAIDHLRITASSMRRAFLVEVMGRHCGYLALMAGIAGGTEVIALPEVDMEPERVAEELRAAYDRGKSHAIAVVAEGAKYNAEALLRYFHEHHDRLGFELRVTKLGHIQRGGSPGVFDRMLGTLFGAGAVDAAVEQRYGTLIGMRDGKTSHTPLLEVAGKTKPADIRMLELARLLAM